MENWKTLCVITCVNNDNDNDNEFWLKSNYRVETKSYKTNSLQTNK